MKCVNPSVGRLFTALGLALLLAHAARAQVVIDLSIVRTEDAPLPAATPSRARKPASHVPVEIPLPFPSSSLWDYVKAVFSPGESDFRVRALSESPRPPLVLDTFNASGGSGSERPSTSWVGQVTQNAGSITVGGGARNDNGWGATSLNLDATGLMFLTVTAQRDPGHAASSLFLQLEDRAASTNTHVIAIDTSLFGLGVATRVQVPVGSWSSQFLVDAIGSWSIGGGGVGTLDFRMTLFNVELTSTAIPEPATIASVCGLAVFGIALHRRRRARSGASTP